MANTSTVEVTGLKELDALLKTLPAKIEGNIMRGGMRASLKVLGDVAKTNLAANGTIKTGNLQKSIRIGFKRKSETGYGWMRGRLSAGNKDAWYAHFIEFGTASFYTGQGKTVGKPYEIRPKNHKSLFFAGLMREVIVHPGIHPKPFMRPAFDQASGKAITSFADYLRVRLPKELAKAAR